MPYMPESPSATELDDIVKISPPASYVALAGMDHQPGQPKFKLEPVEVERYPIDVKPSGITSGKKEIKQEVEEVDVQKMMEVTVKRVRAQSDR
jgi:hypothetical protein